MSARPRTIAVLSQVWAGHIPAYHRLYVDAFRAAGCRVCDVRPASTPAGWLARLWRQGERVGWVLGRRAWRSAARSLVAAEREVGPVEAAFIVFLERGFLQPAISPAAVERWFRWPWAGVTNSPAAVRGPGPAFAGAERVLGAANCRAVVVTDPLFVPLCQRSWPGRTVVAMPEVADLTPPGSPPEVAALRSFAAGRRVVGLLGVISEKKNVGAFLDLARTAQTARPDLAFVIAGDFGPDACPGPERRRLSAVLAAVPANCRVFPAPIPEGAAFNAWVAACDVLWVAYRQVLYQSNVLTKAAHFARPVLVSPGAVMAAHTERHRLGEVVDVDDSGAVLGAVARLLAAPANGRDFAGFAALNAPERMHDTVAAVLAALEVRR